MFTAFSRVSTSALVGAALLAAAALSTPAALAAGGEGASYCSNATGATSGPTPFSAGNFGTFANPGAVVSALIGILWGQGVGAPSRPPGAFTGVICNPNTRP